MDDDIYNKDLDEQRVFARRLLTLIAEAQSVHGREVTAFLVGYAGASLGVMCDRHEPFDAAAVLALAEVAP